MAAQYTYDQVKQGTAVLLERSPNGLGHVGTDALAVCVGVHVRVRGAGGDARFVAHFDSDAVAKSKGDAVKVAAWTRNWMTERLGPYHAASHLEVATFSGGNDFSTAGMHDGICQWMGAPFAMTRQDNFWAPFGEGGPTAIPAHNLGRPLQGPMLCTVPADVLGVAAVADEAPPRRPEAEAANEEAIAAPLPPAPPPAPKPAGATEANPNYAIASFYTHPFCEGQLQLLCAYGSVKVANEGVRPVLTSTYIPGTPANVLTLCLHLWQVPGHWEPAKLPAPFNWGVVSMVMPHGPGPYTELQIFSEDLGNLTVQAENV